MNLQDIILFQVMLGLAVGLTEWVILRAGFLRFNRIWLLLLPLVSMIIWLPLSGSIPGTQFAQVLPEIQVSLTPYEATSGWSFMSVLILAYLSISAFFFVRSWLRVGALFRKGQVAPNGLSPYSVRFVDGQPTQSFWKTIFLNPKDRCEPWILAHEEAHIQQFHSLDLIWVQIFWALNWINPLMWRWRMLVRQNHEYLADRAVLDQPSSSKNDYIRLLLDKAFDTRHFSVGHTFSWNSLTFKRIKMINQAQKRSPLKMGLGLGSILFLGLWIAACNPTTPSPVNPEETAEEKSHKKVDQPPSFEGGNQALFAWLGKELKYPEDCKETGIEGKVVVAFVINAEGGIEQAEIKQSVHELLDAEALRVVNAMPKWVPGMHDGQSVSVKYQLPIMFAMN
ncbi:TonB family protein [bacterium SCSIO 12741]|nr:TonB family protein [bacterium SCSIO 12741]